MKLAKLGGASFLLEFEDGEEVDRVLKRGVRWFKDRLLCLERWNAKVGCLQLGNLTKEVWVRVVSLPLHFLNGEVFRKIGDCCRGFIGVDEDIRRFSQLQWAKILVKLEGKDLLGTLWLVVDFSCFAIQLWWGVPPWVSIVVPMNRS